MALYVKSIDSKHLLDVGMEGFYGVGSRTQYNPAGFQGGTDFISNNLVKEIDFTTIHAYPDVWLPGGDYGARMGFLRQWITIHWADSRKVLKKSMIFAEFGKSSKDPGYSVVTRDAFLNGVYSTIYRFARSGGLGGGLVWQIMDKSMDSYHDGYEIVLSETPSTSAVISQHSRQMTALHAKDEPQAMRWNDAFLHFRKMT